MATQSTSQAVALNYGFNWITGTKLQGVTLTDTGSDTLDFTRIGFWLLGEGEMDGLDEMWDTGLARLLWQSENDDPTKLHFHQGCDAVVGTGTDLYSIGGDQGCDTFWKYLPPGLIPLHYNRWAYYAIMLKQLINNPPNTNQNDSTVWADVNPVGLWRGQRCRIFDSAGALSSYAFTRNPAWHYVDLLCRRKLFTEYSIDEYLGADDLPAAVRNRFDWGALADAQAYYAEVMANGMPRFTGDYSFGQQATLQGCLTQIATCARSFNRERNGKFALIPDKQRASVFTFARGNADSFKVTDADVHVAPNVQVGQFRDILPPAFATIASISCPDHQTPVITTTEPHCAVDGDYIVLGNTGTRYDGNWVVASVPAEDVNGNVFQMTLVNKGSNYPVAVGTGGLIGFRYSRFKDRSPLFHHKAHQLARGAVGIGIPRQRNKIPQTTDFANSTWDQVARVCEYLNGTSLGPDATPYINPKRATLKAPLFAPDAAGSGAIALQLEPGDVVTIDPTLDTTYAGMWEITKEAIDLTGSESGEGSSRSPAAGGTQLTLTPYSDANYPDASTITEPGWPVVPMLPGGDVTATKVPLADGDFSFFTGSGADGDTFQMPDGYSPTYMIPWASPQGYIEANGQLHFIFDCDAYLTRKLALVYDDGHTDWRGDLNYCGVVWRTRSSAKMFSYQNAAFVELTLLGGEKILFGKGTVISGTQIGLPPGYVDKQTVALAFPKSATDSGNPTHGFSAYIDNGGIIRHVYQDGEGNHWEGQAQIFIVAYQNNLGTWRVDPSGWAHCTLPNGQTFAIGGFSILDPGCAGVTPTIYNAGLLKEVLAGGVIPALTNMPSTSLQTMTGPNGFQIVDHPAHGVKQCFVDGDLNASCTFEDGEGNGWFGSSGVFGLLYDTATGALGGSAPPSGGVTWPGAGSDEGGGGGDGPQPPSREPIGAPIFPQLPGEGGDGPS